VRLTYHFAREAAYSGALQLLALYWNGQSEEESAWYYLRPYLSMASVV
jgi:hypothetical protein